MREIKIVINDDMPAIKANALQKLAARSPAALKQISDLLDSDAAEKKLFSLLNNPLARKLIKQ